MWLVDGDPEGHELGSKWYLEGEVGGSYNTFEVSTKETTSLKKPCGLVARASLKNEIFKKILINYIFPMIYVIA